MGQSHFIKTVEDLYETLVISMPGSKFGLSFCEASGKALVRYDGKDEDSKRIAIDFATRLGAGHTFVVVLKDTYPINILNRIKGLDEVATVYCATANRLTVILAETDSGRGILGVVDGVSPKGVESDSDRAERKDFLRRIGYKR